MDKTKDTSQIRINVSLDEDKIPEAISWEADDFDSPAPQQVNSVFLGCWENQKKELIQFDLWVKDTLMVDMKMFQVNLIGALAKNMRLSTNDEYMANETEKLAEKLFKHLKKQHKK